MVKCLRVYFMSGWFDFLWIFCINSMQKNVYFNRKISIYLNICWVFIYVSRFVQNYITTYGILWFWIMRKAMLTREVCSYSDLIHWRLGIHPMKHLTYFNIFCKINAKQKYIKILFHILFPIHVSICCYSTLHSLFIILHMYKI